MNAGIPQELDSLRKRVAGFVDDELIPLEGRSLADGVLKPELESRLAERCKELGLWQVDVPKEFGGQGLGLRARAIIWSELGRTVALPTRNVRILGPEVRPVLYALKGDMRERYLLPVMRGEKEYCFAQTEPRAGSDPGSMTTSAVRRGDAYVLNGTKRFIGGAHLADFMLLMAATDPEKGSRGGISCFVVDMDTKGVELVRSFRTFTDENPWEIRLQDVVVPPHHLVGAEGEGFKLGQRWLVGGRIKQGARATGAIRRLLHLATGYAKSRITFGQPLTDRQYVQWQLADTYVALQAAELLVSRTAERFDRGEDIRHDAPMVKLFCTEAAWKAADMCLQIHGGIGLTTDLPVERFWRDQRSHLITEGTPEMMRLTIARNVIRQFA